MTMYIKSHENLNYGLQLTGYKHTLKSKLRFCMFVVLEKFEEIKSKFTLAQIQQGAITAVIVIILLWSIIAIFRPVSTHQLRNVENLKKQQRYPHSHLIAHELLSKDKISMGQYLKLMHVYQYEYRRARQLAPLKTEQD